MKNSLKKTLLGGAMAIGLMALSAPAVLAAVPALVESAVVEAMQITDESARQAALREIMQANPDQAAEIALLAMQLQPESCGMIAFEAASAAPDQAELIAVNIVNAEPLCAGEVISQIAAAVPELSEDDVAGFVAGTLETASGGGFETRPGPQPFNTFNPGENPRVTVQPVTTTAENPSKDDTSQYLPN